MVNRNHLFWKMNVFLVLIFTVVFTLSYFQKGLGQKDKHVFLLKNPFLIALDDSTFNNDALFQRATLLTAPALTFKTTLRQFSKPITALTAAPFTMSASTGDLLYLTQGFNLIEVSNQKDHMISLHEVIGDPIVALAHHPKDSKIYALTESNKLYEILLKSKDLENTRVRALGTVENISQDLTPQEMWVNPITSRITLALSKSEDSVLFEFNPENLSEKIQELALPHMVISGGFFLSQDLMFLMDHHYQIHIVDRKKKLIMGTFFPNQNFQYLTLLSHPPLGFTFADHYCYWLDDTASLHQIQWKPSGNTIMINQDIGLANGHVMLQWKTPQKSDKALYLAQLSLEPKSVLTAQKTSLEMDYIETAAHRFDVSLMAIHSESGEMLSPAVTFTVETGGKD